MFGVSRQNVYDDSRFFRLYQEMRDSQTGINEVIYAGVRRGCTPTCWQCGPRRQQSRPHYVADFDEIMARIAGWLVPGGEFVASMEHPIVTALPEPDRGRAVVDQYASEGGRETSWNIDGVTKCHRRLSTIVNAVINAGLTVRHVGEPIPTAETLEQHPGLDFHLRRPPILTVAASKSAG